MAGVLCALLCGFWLGEEQTQLAGRVIRFHVIANSDSPEDQALKLQVRDAVLSATEEFYPQEASLEEARGCPVRSPGGAGPGRGRRRWRRPGTTTR